MESAVSQLMFVLDKTVVRMNVTHEGVIHDLGFCPSIDLRVQGFFVCLLGTVMFPATLNFWLAGFFCYKDIQLNGQSSKSTCRAGQVQLT